MRSDAKYQVEKKKSFSIKLSRIMPVIEEAEAERRQTFSPQAERLAKKQRAK